MCVSEKSSVHQETGNSAWESLLSSGQLDGLSFKEII